MEENISLEDKIRELEKRVQELENIEHRRKTKAIVTAVIKISVYVLLLIAAFFAFKYVKETVIDPYRETIEEIEGVKDTSSDLINKYKTCDIRI